MGQSVELVESELHAASARLESAAQRLKDGLASVDDETTQLLGSGWKGGAASAYGPAWDGWLEGAEQVVQALQRMSELLSIAGKEYAKTDQAGADALGSTVQGSGGETGSGDSGGSGAPRPQGLPDLGLGDPSGTSSGGAGGQSGDVGQQAMSPVSQLGQAAAGMAQQSGQAVAGLAQQAAQLAMGLAQQAGQAHGTGDAQNDKADALAADALAADAPPAQGADVRDEDKKDEEREREEAEKRDRERDDPAAASGERSTGTAPVDRGDVTPAPDDQAIKRTR